MPNIRRCLFGVGARRLDGSEPRNETRRRGRVVSRTTAAVAAASVSALLVTSCAGSTVEPPQSSATGQAGSSQSWTALVDQAKKEGQVTIYGSIPQANMNSAVQAFQTKYGLKVNVFRNVDAPDEAKLNAEHTSG